MSNSLPTFLFQMRARFAYRLAATAIAAFVLVQSATAATVTWTGSTDTTWSQPDTTSWSATYNSGDDVVFADTGVGIITISGTVTPGNISVTNTSGTYQFNTGAIGGSGTLSKSGNGALRLNAPNSFTGLTTISGSGDNRFNAASTPTAHAIGGDLTINSGYVRIVGTGGNQIPDTARVTINSSGTLGLDGRFETIGGLDGSGGVANFASSGLAGLTVGGGNSSGSFSGTISGGLSGSGSLSLTKIGSGTQILSNSGSSYTGATTINAGVLQVTTLANGGSNSSIGRSINAATNLVFGAPAATLRYDGTANVTTNRGFTLSSGAGGGATIESSGTGTLSFDNTVAIAYGTTGETRTLTLGGTNTGANTFGKTIADNGAGATSLVKSGAGTWTLSATNTYTGGTTVDAGTLKAGVASVANVSGAFGNNSAVTLANVAGATLDLNGFNTQIGSLTGGGAASGNVTLGAATLTTGGDNTSPAAYAGVISGAGGLTKIGTGTQTLAGANTYGGTTTVTGGTLKVSGTHTGGGAYAIGAGATLGGTGTIGSTIGGAGLVSPGNSPGILTVAQVDPSGGMDFGFEFMGASPTWSNAALSVNDVLRITDPTTPFTMGSMDGDNVVSIYLNVTTLTDNDTFDGGFFTDRDLNFLAEVAGADYDFYVLGDGLGADATFMGNDYYSLANFAALNMLTISLAVGVVQVPTADFDGPDVTNGWVTRFTADVAGINDAVVPEPASIAVWAFFGLGLVAFGACRLRRRGGTAETDVH